MRHWRKFGAGGLLAIVLAIQLFLAMPQRAYAEAPVSVTSNGPEAALEAVHQVQENTKMTLTGAIFTGIINLLTFAANRLAYDAAVMLSSGGSADQPLVEYRTPEDYFADYASAVAGEAVYMLDEELGDNGLLAGFNLCSPAVGSPEIMLKLKMGIREIYQRPEARCEFTDIHKNWKGFLAETARDFEGGVFRNELILTQLSEAFDPSVNEFAVGIQLYSDVLGASKQSSEIAGAKLIAQGPVKDVTDAITNRVETPASMINYEYMQNQANLKEVPLQIAYATLTNTDALLQVGISAGSVFGNTLLSRLTSKLYSGLFDFDAVEDIDPFDQGMWASSNRDQAQQRFRSLLATVPLQVTNYSLLSEFSSCPSQARGLYNCVADSSFISAIARAESGVAMTLEEAIEDDLINGNWPLISSSDTARDQDPYCYTYGYCHGNIVKLRKARILPIGWELAAESTANSTEDPATLQEVMDGFDDCNTSGDRDDNHPWCKLIDPNWVLKYPDTQCKALVYGQLLETSASDTRQQECVDMPSCIAEDENGVCTGGYGYCVREENTWRFRGDACPAYAASCLSFEDSDGEESSYVLNTVDYGPCTEDNAGCSWYWTTQEEGTDGVLAWPTVTEETITALDAADGTHEDRVYFTAAVENCDAEDGGCTELVERNDDLRLNEIANSGFEDDEDGNGLPDAWSFIDTSTLAVDTVGDYSRTGDGAVNPGTGLGYQTGIILQQGTFYTLSYYARQASSGATASMIVAFEDEDTGEVIDLTGTSYSDGCDLYNGDTSILEIAGEPEGTNYERFECTFTVPTLSNATSDLFVYVDFMAADVWIDDIQLEQGEDASDYHEGYSEIDLSYTYAKVAPSYLGCEGDSDDPEACTGYAQVCSETDVGCTAYSPTNGDPTVYGVASNLDACPSTCNGYDTYKQEATLYEPAGDFPVYFIPDTAEVCTEEEVGCDEFTRLDDESLAYFSYLRACVTPTQADANGTDDGEATFYTWEGSDLTGYQLITWSLLESDLDSVTNDTYDGSGIVEEESGRAPCTNWTATDNGVECNDDGDDGNSHFDTDSTNCDEHDDIFSNPNCREFYDTEGGIHYRDWSLTVTVNDQCASYRKTDLVGLNVDSDGDGVLDNLDADANCTESGGFFDDATASCRYYGFEDESQTCSESANGCREYTGGRSRNSRLVLEETFEGGDLTAWESEFAETTTYSNESVATDGHSIASVDAPFWSYMFDNEGVCDDGDTGEGCEGDDGTLGGTCTVRDGQEYCGTLVDELYTDKTYTVSFWAKGTGDLTVGFDMDADTQSPDVDITSEDPSFGTIELSASNWEEYQLGPLNIDADTYPTFGDDTVLAFVPAAGVTFYVDNIVIREGEQNITLIKDSWVTPSECDENPDGEDSAQYYLGCQEYSTHEGDTAYLKSFSSLCSEDVVGCNAFFATQQSASPYAEVYNATCTRLDTTDTSSPVDCYREVTEDGLDFDTTSQFLCTIGVSVQTCQFDLDWYIPATALAAYAPHLSYGPETEIVPADSSAFLVVTDAVECDSSAMGCTELGAPVYSADRQSINESESVYLLNLPDDYDDILCTNEELFCEEWDTADEGTFYFKDPLQQTCEYRTDVTVNGSTYDGWFRTDTNDFCYGTCEASGDACSTDADCGDGDSCDATAGSYVVGGDQSGIWMNGDDSYGGWVGSCDAEYDGCREFIDLLDLAEDEFYGEAEGEAYYYLDNDALLENGLPSAQKCNGQVSQKEGCGLFNDTTESGVLYSASATYIASTHADALFGDKPYGLVDPIDCESGNSIITEPDGTEVDLCTQRCQYNNDDLYDLTDSGEGAYTYGTSCYVDNDCVAYDNESGESVEGSCEAGVTRLDNDVNRVVKVNRDRQCSEWLSCSNMQTVWDERTNSYRTICGDISLCDEYSADGSSSFCSSWKRDSTAAIIDIDRYSERDVSWYGDEYSGMSIPDRFSVELLDQKLVSPPSGLCDMTGLYDLSNEPYDYTSSALHGTECDQDDTAACTDGDVVGTCVTEDAQDFDLVFDAGTCSEDYGESCTVGYCENTGESCSATADCSTGAGSCVTGVCYEEYNSCASDSECDTGTCRAGVCSVERGTLAIEDSGVCGLGGGGYLPTLLNPGTIVYNDSVLAKLGTCIRESCMLTAEGNPYEISNDNGGQVCRGFPEANSPFPNEVVKSWKYLPRDPRGGWEYTEDLDEVIDGALVALPYETVSGFGNANTCLAGEDCSCNYKKFEYEDDTGVTRTFSWDSDAANDRVGVCVNSDAASGESFDGVLCSNDAEIADGSIDIIDETSCELGVQYDGSTYEYGGGTCVYPERMDSVLGLEGYCLERDTSINIHGNRDDEHRACINWLPVDQLSGSTDLYAKYLGAGYFDESYVCTYTEPFIDLYTTPVPASMDAGFSPGDVACAETAADFMNADGEDGTDGAVELGVDFTNSYFSHIFYDSGSAEGCAERAVCPEGYWTLMGQPSPDEDSAKTTLAETCNTGLQVADCPYVCVPHGAYVNTGTEELSCEPEGPDVAVMLEANGSSWDHDYVDDVYIVGQAVEAETEDTGEELFDSIVEDLMNCRAVGVKYDEDIASVLDIPGSYDIANGGTDESDSGGYSIGSYRYLSVDGDIYPACGVATQAAGAVGNDFVSFAWTDRMRNAESGFQIESEEAKFEYVFATPPSPFGVTMASPAAREAFDPPFMVAGCGGSTIMLSPETVDTCATGVVDTDIRNGDTGTSLSSPEARSYIDYTLIELGMYGKDAASITRSWSVTETEETVMNRITQLFATLRYGTQYNWLGDWSTDGDASNDLAYEADTVNDYSAYDVRAEEGQPPRVWSLELGSCEGDQCEEGEEGELTLNNANSGTQEGNEFFRAYLKFYAAAYKEQLPIRRIMIDWGDGRGAVGSPTDDNFYKNHRGLLEGGDASYCDTDNEWGMTSASCDPYYFSYSNIYTCSGGMINTMQLSDDAATASCQFDEDGNLVSSPCADASGSYCYFQPKVHIRDNWGWCTGQCDSALDEDVGEQEGCFEGTDTTPFDTFSVFNECNYDIYPNTGDTLSIDPWVYYDGVIAVSP